MLVPVSYVAKPLFIIATSTASERITIIEFPVQALPAARLSILPTTQGPISVFARQATVVPPALGSLNWPTATPAAASSPVFS